MSFVDYVFPRSASSPHSQPYDSRPRLASRVMPECLIMLASLPLSYPWSASSPAPLLNAVGRRARPGMTEIGKASVHRRLSLPELTCDVVAKTPPSSSTASTRSSEAGMPDHCTSSSTTPTRCASKADLSAHLSPSSSSSFCKSETVNSIYDAFSHTPYCGGGISNTSKSNYATALEQPFCDA